MRRFEILLRVLDSIRREGCDAKHTKLYALNENEKESVWYARARAYVHLYLKVMFGIRNFYEREALVTDGSYDGGINGFHIDSERKSIVLIQAKFRASEELFEERSISIEEILKMQLKRVLYGEETDFEGNEYNCKIKGLQRRLAQIPDLGRYTFKVVLLANFNRSIGQIELERLADGYSVEVFDHQKSYEQLLLPVVAGNLFKAQDISIYLDLSNKGSGTKIYYNVTVSGFDCAITVVFVPIKEIAKLVSEYQNSVLKYNPRSYLEFAGAPVNRAIRETALAPHDNDFALLNNGITLICDKSKVTEESGIKHVANLYLLNPQIINGGQTAYTLSRLYDELEEKTRDDVFSGKEVLVKAMALTATDGLLDEEASRREVIKRISAATNTQTAVTHADRTSTDDVRVGIQALLYRRHGILLENKKGEFSEGIKLGYLKMGDLIERNLFQRLYFVANGKLNLSTRRKVWREPLPVGAENDLDAIDNFSHAFKAWKIFEVTNYGRNPYLQAMPKVYATLLLAGTYSGERKMGIEAAAALVNLRWQSFLESERLTNKSLTGLVASPRDEDQQVGGKRRNRGSGLAAKIQVFINEIEALADQAALVAAEQGP